MSPTLSVCLIVRDEEALLDGCLQSVAPLADEVVVIDTGSTDRTIEIACAHGAHVGHFAWSDDFAAARNASLDAATSDWVLVIDADERLAPGAAGAIRALIAAEPADAPPTAYCPLIESVDADGRPLGADHMPRLWRHRPAIRFRGRVHERLELDGRPLRVAPVDHIRLMHLGYDPVIAAAKDKRARNRKLLLAERAARPDDRAVDYYLAKEDYALGDDAAALAGFRRVIDAGEPPNLALSSVVFAVECLRHLDRVDDALALARDALAAQPEYGELAYTAARAAFEAGRLAVAAEWVEGADRKPRGVAAAAFRDPSITRWRADLLRAQIARAEGDLTAAAERFAAVRPRVPAAERPAVDLDAADVALALGHAEDAWALVEPLIDVAPADVTAPLLALVQGFIDHQGLAPAYGFLVELLTAHPLLLHQLPLVGAAAEIAEAVGDEPRRAQWLTLCVQLDSPHPEHHEALADLLDAADRPADAAAIRARAPEAEG